MIQTEKRTAHQIHVAVARARRAPIVADVLNLLGYDGPAEPGWTHSINGQIIDDIVSALGALGYLKGKD